MEEKVSETIKEKGRKLFEEGKVTKDLETDRRIYFRVKGETESHSVIFDKEKNELECDCQYWSLRLKTCSHTFACSLFLKKAGGKGI